MASINIKQVNKTYGQNVILEQIDLDIKDGEFIVLVGPSGCGKSTLLRMIAGLEDVTKGEILIGNEDVTHAPPKERNISMVFQSYALYPHMSVKDNMSYSLKLSKVPKKVIDQKIAQISSILGLEKLLERRPKALSGGQRQRVAMGRAIVREPKAFLFDEPLSNLDARLREQMRAEIKKLHSNLNATSIYVTHDQIEAMTLADRIVAMNEGKIQQIGSPQELYKKPANLFVASFIGSPGMNFLPAQYISSGDGNYVELDNGTTLSLEKSLPLIKNAKLTIGIRPENIQISEQSSVKVRVELIEPTGPGDLIHFSLGTNTMKLYTQASLDIQPGDIIGITLPESSLHYFNVSGDRIPM